MRIAQILSVLALAGVLVPPMLYFGDQVSLDAAKAWIFAATVVWFVVTPAWMNRRRPT